MVWAAGGSPRRLAIPDAIAGNVLTVRTLADVDRLKALSADADRIVVIGGGYIGLEATLSGFEGAHAVETVCLADEARIASDLVVVGIGIVPEIGPLQDAGASYSTGVEVDEYCRTSLPDVFAIGDCAAHRNAYVQCARIRLESVQNAADMARTVAECIQGKDEAYPSVSWFWSDQFDLRIQTVGLSSGRDATIVRGDMAAALFPSSICTGDA